MCLSQVAHGLSCEALGSLYPQSSEETVEGSTISLLACHLAANFIYVTPTHTMLKRCSGNFDVGHAQWTLGVNSTVHLTCKSEREILGTMADCKANV